MTDNAMTYLEYLLYTRIAAIAGWRHSDPILEIYSAYATVNSRKELMSRGKVLWQHSVKLRVLRAI